MSEAWLDVAVLGAGPAGAAAACEAAARGLRVAVLDEQPAAGGQVYRMASGIAPIRADDERAEGDRLRAELASSAAERRFAHRVWHVEHEAGGFALHALGPDGPALVQARKLIVATGALERSLPFPGWDLPGVMGLAAATVLLKAQRMLPGHRVLVAGSGPLLYAVAKGIVDGGGEVVALVDARSRSAWWRRAPAMSARLDLVRRGLAWQRMLRAAGVPIRHGTRVESVEARGDGMLLATLVPVDAEGAPRTGANATTIECDALCCGFGLIPATDVTRALRATHVFDAARGGWHAQVDADQRTDVEGLYVAGDGAGIEGAAAAAWQGRIAALAAARDLGRMPARDGADDAVPLRAARARAARFGRAMTELAHVGDGAIASLPVTTPMCLCEGLSRHDLEQAIAAGCRTMNELRSATRCGMGPCGGRVCEEAAARLLALRTGQTREAVGQPTGRSPLRPVEIDAIAGDFDYDALPLPAPAPL